MTPNKPTTLRDREKKQKNVQIVALVEKRESIDFTPIYYITLVKQMKKGEIIRFDSATTFITSDKK